MSKSIIGPLLTKRTLSVYREWLKNDQFGNKVIGPYPREPLPVKSFRELIKNLSMIGAMSKQGSLDLASVVFPEVSNFDMSFADFLSYRYTAIGGRAMTVGTLAYEVFCVALLPRLMGAAFWSGAFSDDDNVTEAELLAESGCADTREFFSLLKNPIHKRQIADVLYQEMLRIQGGRTLRSFFHTEMQEHGYRGWWPGSRTGIGYSLKPRHTPCSLGNVISDVSRYEGNESLPVKAYEWCSELYGAPKSDVPDAITYGMVYVFKRRRGVTIAGKSDLLWAADEVADTDVLQVNSFFEQHPDADEIIETSDLCFVWLWERRHTATKGAGSECIKAALTDIKKRFPRVNTVLIDIRPYQFQPWDGQEDPPIIEVEKQQASEKLLEYIEGLDLGRFVNGECRYIINRHENDPNMAMMVLGKDSLENMLRNDEL